MKPKTLVLMVVAVVCGLGASYMTSRLLAERNAPQQVEVEKVQVLVAKQKIGPGVMVKEPDKFFVWKSFTKGEEPKKALTSMEQVKDRRLNKPLAEEQFVTAEDLMDPKAQGMEAMLPIGMRAIAVRVTAATSVSGFVQPGSRVDVLNTLRYGDDGLSQVILQNMLVLAADMSNVRDVEKQASISSTVTLAARPEDAAKLRLAEAMGELSLILRGGEDDEKLRVKPIKPRDVVRNADGGAEGAEGGDPSSVGAPPPLVGVPDAPTMKPAETPSTATAATIEKPSAPAPEPPQTFTQVVYNGESVTKTIFLVGKTGEVTTRQERTGLEREPKPEKKAEEKAKDAPADDAREKPTPDGKKETESAAAPNRGK